MSWNRLPAMTVAAACCCAGHGAVIFVDAANCPGPGDGSQFDPFCEIQSGIVAAGDGDHVLVAPGTYTERIDLYGKAITLRATDGPEVTIIDGQGTGTVVTCDSGEGPDTVLQGFTFTGGVGSSGPFGTAYGGGMYIDSAAPAVIGCTFINNTAVARGGGMACFGASPSLIECSFIGNVCSNFGFGGGIHFEYSIATLEDCRFFGNSADAAGGGISAVDSQIALERCALGDNEADLGGALLSDSSDIDASRCRLVGNVANDSGGAIYAVGSGQLRLVNCDASYNSTGSEGILTLFGGPGAEIVNCTFVGSVGHSIWVAGATPAVTSSILWGGTLDHVAGPGSAVVTYSDIGGGWPGPGANNIAVDPQFADQTSGTWTSDPIYDPVLQLAALTDDTAAYAPGELVGRWIAPDAGFEALRTAIVANATTTITVRGNLWPVLVAAGDPYLIRDHRLSAPSPCIDAGDNTAVPDGVTTDLDGLPRFLDVPETPDTGNGDPPVVDMGAYEALGDGCLAITNLETICHGDGTTFTVNVEGLNACTGGATQATFTASGGAVGEDLCATLIVNTEQGGYCCSTQICVPVPDCSGAVALCDLNGDGVLGVADFLLLLAAWGPHPGDPADLDFDGAVGIGDFLILLANWGP